MHAPSSRGAGTVVPTSSRTLASPWEDMVATMEDPRMGNAG